MWLSPLFRTGRGAKWIENSSNAVNSSLLCDSKCRQSLVNYVDMVSFTLGVLRKVKILFIILWLCDLLCNVNMLQCVMLSPLSKPNSRIVVYPNIFWLFFSSVSWVFDWCTINNHQVHIHSLVKLCSAIDLSCSDICRVLQNMCLLFVCVCVCVW